MRIMGDEIGLVVKTGEDGAFLLLEITESMVRKDVELGEKGTELELPLLLLVCDSLVVMEVLDRLGD